MSESDRTPGYRNRSHVPPMASRASKIVNVRRGSAARNCRAAPMPDSPAPTISTSTRSAVLALSPLAVPSAPVCATVVMQLSLGGSGINATDE
jgi:hypothetical protein